MSASSDQPNVKEAVPFFGVTDMEASLQFYVDGLGFVIEEKWEPEGRIRWCSLRLGKASIMLQEYVDDGHHKGRPDGRLGQGVSVCFMCEDALAIFHEAQDRGLNPSQPFVGNAMWVTSLQDPDGFAIDFESYTDAPEGTAYQEAG